MSRSRCQFCEEQNIETQICPKCMVPSYTGDPRIKRNLRHACAAPKIKLCPWCRPRGKNPSDDGDVLIEYGTIQNQFLKAGGWLPVIWRGGKMYGMTWAHKGHDYDEALRLGKMMAEEEARHYIGDWRVTVRKHPNEKLLREPRLPGGSFRRNPSPRRRNMSTHHWLVTTWRPGRTDENFDRRFTSYSSAQKFAKRARDAGHGAKVKKLSGPILIGNPTRRRVSSLRKRNPHKCRTCARHGLRVLVCKSCGKRGVLGGSGTSSAVKNHKCSSPGMVHCDSCRRKNPRIAGYRRSARVVGHKRRAPVLRVAVLKRGKKRNPATLHERIAAALGWTVAQTQSFSLPALRDLVRPVSPALASEISSVLAGGSHVAKRRKNFGVFQGSPVGSGPLVRHNPLSPGQETEATELHLYITNDEPLYRQRLLPSYKNLVTKMARGTYNREAAVKLFMYTVDEGAKKYTREHGSPGHAWNVMFSRAVRLDVARALRDEFEVEAKLGNYNRYLPKKYQKNPRARTRVCAKCKHHVSMHRYIPTMTGPGPCRGCSCPRYVPKKRKNGGFNVGALGTTLINKRSNPKRRNPIKSGYFKVIISGGHHKKGEHETRVVQGTTAEVRAWAVRKAATGYKVTVDGPFATEPQPGWRERRAANKRRGR